MARQAMPLALIGQAIPQLSRHDLEALTERLIERLDEVDSNADLEPDGDELDGSAFEEDWHPATEIFPYPGCPISDPGEHNGDTEPRDWTPNDEPGVIYP